MVVGSHAAWAGVPGSLVGGKHRPRPRKAIVIPLIAAGGDRPQPMIIAIDEIATHEADATCLVWVIDLQHEPSPRRSRAELKHRYDLLLARASTYPGLRHLVVLYLHDRKIPERKVHATAAGVATRLHADLERARARYVDVAAIDITTCQDTKRLIELLEDIAVTVAGPVGNVALTWDEIRDRGIHAAAADSQF